MALCSAILLAPSTLSAKQWTLKECISYALQNNIQLQKTLIQKQIATENWLQSKAAMLPSLSASTNQNINYTPWVESGISSAGYSRSSVDKVYYNGNYSVSGNWTVWDGNRSKNSVKLNQLEEQRAEIDSATQALNIQEQITQLYIQILYSAEAVKVNQEILVSSQANETRGKEFYKNGKMSKADLAQLTAQRAQDEYNIVAAESQNKNYKRQLKELLQLTNEDFDIVFLPTTDTTALQAIPALADVYVSALNYRPEIKAYQNSIQQSDLNFKIAKAGNLPTISANAGVSTSTTSMNSLAWGRQLKSNFGLGAGITISVPLFDNRSKKTAVNKALLQRQSAILDLKNEQTTLYSTIENYWLQATTNQNQLKAAQASTNSAQISYQLVSEKLKEGLANVVDVRTEKDNLLKAKQNELQAKYLTVFNIDMLQLYKDGVVK